MKKHLSYALLTISIIGFNALPAKAANDSLQVSQLQLEASSSGDFCVRLPHVGSVCYDSSFWGF